MKKVTLVIVSLIITFASMAQSEFENAMRANIDSLYQSFGTGTVLKPVNTFERLAYADTTRWEPLYYAAYGYCMLSLHETDDAKKDLWCDRGQDLLTVALKKWPAESELYVLQGFLYNMRLMVNPMKRAMQYMGPIEQAYSTAQHLDSLNPRVYYMQAQMVMNKPAFIGGGKDKALPIFMKAKQHFDTFTTPNMLAPRWGMDDCLKKIAECGG